MDSDLNVLLVCRYESLEGDSVSIGAWENMHRYANLLTLRTTTDTSSQSEAESIYRKLISGREKFFGCVVCMFVYMFECVCTICLPSHHPPAQQSSRNVCLLLSWHFRTSLSAFPLLVVFSGHIFLEMVDHLNIGQ
jgi:hypothetical protein